MSAELPPDGGLLLVDKPAGCTSHDVVGRLRRVLHTRRIGHAGTLDPMATGLLVVAVERSTKLLGHLALTDKTYLATIRLGQSTTTDDKDGELLPAMGADVAGMEEDDIRAGIAQLTGDILQVPSAVSAIKVDGRRAYERVRAGEQVELAARPVTVRRFDVLGPVRRDTAAIDVDVLVECTTGTYIRSLARDLGAGLGVGGHLTALRRTTVGPFAVAGAVDVYGPAGVPARGERSPEVPAEFSAEIAGAVVPAAQAVRQSFPVRTVDASLAREMRYGRHLG
jgi:tRNA pseudouridine55 synthase